MFIICDLLSVFLILVVGRIILSYFPLSPNSPMSAVYSFVYTVTEPVMGPLRRVIPPIGMIDISPIVIFIGIQVLKGAICR
jgi:YggT family protein